MMLPSPQCKGDRRYNQKDNRQMFSAIQSCWPPAPSQVQTTTGWKMKHIKVPRDHSIGECLVGLHEPSWWTGLQVNVADKDGPIDIPVKVRMVGVGGHLLFEHAGCEWTQQSGSWHSLTWPICSRMANCNILRLEISIETDRTDLYFSTRASYQELPDLSRLDSYLFVTEEGKPIGYWNGGVCTSGSRLEGMSASLGVDYRVVPPLAHVLASGWDDKQMHTLMGWSDKVHMT